MNFYDDVFCTCISYFSFGCDQIPSKKQLKGRHGGGRIQQLAFRSVQLLAHIWADQGVERERNASVQLFFSVFKSVLGSSTADSASPIQKSGSSVRKCGADTPRVVTH